MAEDPENGNGPEPKPAKPTCAVTLVMFPGGGMHIQVHGGERVEREATHADLVLFGAMLTQTCQASETLRVFSGAQPKVVPAASRFNPFRRG